MSPRSAILRVVFFVVIGCLAASARGQVDFGNNDITFSDPIVVGGNAVATVVKQGPTTVKLPNGMRISQFSYTVTAVQVVEIDLTWSATRQFSTGAAALLDLRNVGSTKITMGANNRVDLIANATIGGILPSNVGFISATFTGALNEREVSWDKCGSIQRAAGNHNLTLDSGIVWAPNAVGDTIIVSSFYQAQVEVARERKNYKSLTPTQRNQYVEAVKALKDKRVAPKYDTFVAAHVGTFYETVHKGPMFLPWHRVFILEFENQLRDLDVHTQFNTDGTPVGTSATVKYRDAVGALPYWDWRDPFPSFLGKVRGVDVNGVVTDGPFRQGQWRINVGGVGPAARQMHLQRQFAEGTLPLDAVKMGRDIEHALARPVYDEAPWDSEPGRSIDVGTDIRRSFRNAVEGWVSPDPWAPGGYNGYTKAPRLHNRAHAWVGGNMGQDDSPNDPAFWLNHAFVDKLWCQWQVRHPAAAHYLPTEDLAAAAPHPERKVGLFTKLEHLGFLRGTAVAPFDLLSVRALGYQYDDCCGPPTGLCCVVKPDGSVEQFENYTESQVTQLGPPRIPAGSTKSWLLGMSKADDLNKNCILDIEEIAAGTASDCDVNGIPDDAEPDCDSDNIIDLCESPPPPDDCNSNGLSDACEPDCDGNGTPDDCEPSIDDCNTNGVPDACDLASFDCDENGAVDECEIAAGSAADCNTNMMPDMCDMMMMGMEMMDCNFNGILDECDVGYGSSEDCNANFMIDDCELMMGSAQDCNSNNMPDVCDGDCNLNGLADECDLAMGTSVDCNGDGLPSECHIHLFAQDCNTNGVFDECEGLVDCNSNGLPDECELADADCNANGTADVCEIAAGMLQDCDRDGTPDECESCSDLDGDAGVGGDDYGLLLSSLGFTVYEPEYDPRADVFFDGVVDCQDVADWLCCYRVTIGDPSAPAPAPNPPASITDCNSNNVPDECDIASGASLDADTDGILDECETPACPGCIGDITGDNAVNGRDIAAWVRCALGNPLPADLCACSTGMTQVQFIQKLLIDPNAACP